MTNLLCKNAFDVVKQFEEQIAKIANSKYAVAVDSCTSALFLSLKYLNKTDEVISIPKKTYISVPCSIRNAGYKLKFDDRDWKGIYQLNPLPIYDGALRFKQNMYEGGFHCLSFHVKKHLKIGKGGMILTDDKDAYEWFKLARFNGRNEMNHMNDIFGLIGWNVYMRNEDAARGLWLLHGVDFNAHDIIEDYPDLSVYDFNNTEPGGKLLKI